MPDGATLHWHGVTVPNAKDGVAGVTQDALAPGQSFTYRFVAKQAGTYWYHSHRVSHAQVIGGLLGALVIEPAAAPKPVPDAVAVAHPYAGVRTINGLPGQLKVAAGPDGQVRVRVIMVTQLPGFVRGRPGVWWTINGKVYPNVPMFVVAEVGGGGNAPREQHQ